MSKRDFFLNEKNVLVLSPQEGRSIFLVLMGTFLEYFDLMLYMHLSIILTPRFLPSSDPKISVLLGAFAFCSAYLFRPLGSLIFGYLGDTRGRKACIVVTALLMGLATFTIGVLPSYESAGLTASVCFLVARALQGVSSVGEMISAKVFTVEVAGQMRANSFFGVLPDMFMNFGSLVALGLSMIFLSFDPVNGWRLLFFIGFIVALVSGIVRVKALESPVFLSVMRSDTHRASLPLYRLLNFQDKNYWYYFGIELVGPMAWYFTLRICSDLLRDTGLETREIITHNFVILALNFFFLFFMAYRSLYTDPFVLLKRRYATGLCLLPLIVTLLVFLPHYQGLLFCIQLFTLCAFDTTAPALASIIRTFPVVGRCTSLGSAYAVSHSLVYVVIAVGSAVLQNTFGLWGVGALLLSAALISLYCVCQFAPRQDRYGDEGDDFVDPTLEGRAASYPL